MLSPEEKSFLGHGQYNRFHSSVKFCDVLWLSVFAVMNAVQFSLCVMLLNAGDWRVLVTKSYNSFSGPRHHGTMPPWHRETGGTRDFTQLFFLFSGFKYMASSGAHLSIKYDKCDMTSLSYDILSVVYTQLANLQYLYREISY